jgi:hypothetical protein
MQLPMLHSMASFTALRSQPVVGGEQVVRHASHIRQHRVGGQDVLVGGCTYRPYSYYRAVSR